MDNAVSPKRKANWVRLAVALAASPTVAGSLGGFAIIIAGSMLEVGFSWTPYTLATVFAAIALGVVFCNLFGFPIILMGWALGHFLTNRHPVQFIGLQALMGTLFALAVFGGWIPELHLNFALPLAIPVLSGTMAGLAVGALISHLGYEETPKPA